MPDFFNYRYGASGAPLTVPRAAGFPIQVGDLCWWDPTATPDPADGGVSAGTTGALKSASSYTWGGSLAATQATFAALFAGVSGMRYDGSKMTDDARIQMTGNKLGRHRIQPDGVYLFNCAAGSNFPAGQLVGPDAVAGGSALAPQNVIAVTGKANAIGRVERSWGNVSQILVRVFSAYFAPLTNA